MPEPEISIPEPTAIFQVVKGARIQLLPPDALRIQIGARWIGYQARALPILEAFLKPRVLREAMMELGARAKGRHDWAEVMDTVIALCRHGILREVTGDPSFSAIPSGFDEPTIHVGMLNDRDRVTAYMQAIREIVREGDVVVDIGTGTGVLAAAAARAGARRVYAIESTSMIDRAREIFERNGIADRVKCIPGWSTQIELPERADVVMSETFGNDPRGEGALEIFSDAALRFLAPDGQFIPFAFMVHGMPVEVPARFRQGHLLTDENVNAWSRYYGVDFSPLIEHVGERMVQVLSSRQPRKWKPLSAPVLLAHLSMGRSRFDSDETKTTLEIEREGDLGGFLVFFDLLLSPSVRLTTNPYVTGEDCSWSNLAWLMRVPQRVAVGDRFEVVYRTRLESDRPGVVLRPLSSSDDVEQSIRT